MLFNSFSKKAACNAQDYELKTQNRAHGSIQLGCAYIYVCLCEFFCTICIEYHVLNEWYEHVYELCVHCGTEKRKKRSSTHLGIKKKEISINRIEFCCFSLAKFTFGLKLSIHRNKENDLIFSLSFSLSVSRSLSFALVRSLNLFLSVCYTFGSALYNEFLTRISLME